MGRFKGVVDLVGQVRRFDLYLPTMACWGLAGPGLGADPGKAKPHLPTGLDFDDIDNFTYLFFSFAFLAAWLLKVVHPSGMTPSLMLVSS